jgi:predicted RNA-binding protein with RPS1 domain
LSLLYSSGNITEFNGIFDTQIAHRMCYEDEFNINSNGTKNNAISLNELLKINFNVNVEIKDEIHELINTPYLWKVRPISYKLNYYAGCDVFYLPKLYDLFCKKIETKKVQHITIQDIFNECQKYLNYLSMNKNIKNYNKMNITEGTKLKGLIKNFQNYCVFIQLNIGYIGIIDVFPSVQILKDKYHLGDIVDFTILKVDNKKKRMMLDLCENNEEKNEINLGVNNNEEFKLKLVDNKNNASNLVQGLNLNKESFFPKSYNRNNINSYNYFDNNAFNQYQYNNINYNNNGYDYYNNNYNNNYYENYYNENDTKKDYNNKNYMINNELILNNNYNGLFYDYEGKYYYYNNDDDANNEDNKDENDNSYYYTLKPFPK